MRSHSFVRKDAILPNNVFIIFHVVNVDTSTTWRMTIAFVKQFGKGVRNYDILKIQLLCKSSIHIPYQCKNDVSFHYPTLLCFPKTD